MADHLQQFFKLCDPEGKKSVDREAFKKLCKQFGIADRDANIIFEDLDVDHDDQISFEDFSRGFSDYLHTAGASNQDSDSQQNEVREKDEDDWSPHLEEEIICNKNSQSQKLQMVFEELHSSEKQHLVPYLENTVEELLHNLHQLQEENTLLGETWQKEKIEHESHLKRMEEVMDSQVREAEMELRQKAQEEVEDARKTLQIKMDAEMDNLQAHLALFEKVNSWLQTHPTDGKEARLDELRQRLDDADNENRQLRLSLLDTKTSIAVVQSQSLQMRNLYEEKCKELMNERVKIREVLNQQDDLSQQLTLLHDANRRLQDTNDALRHSMERLNTSQKRATKSFDVPTRGKCGSVIGDYMEPAYSTGNMSRVQDIEDDDNDDVYEPICEMRSRPTLRRARSVDMPFAPSPKRTITTEPVMGEVPMNHSDSGFSTTRESQELEETSTPDSSLPLREEVEEVKHSTPLKRPLSFPTSHSENDLDVSEVEDTIPKQVVSTVDVVQFKERNLKSSSSADNLESDDYPKRKIVDIIRQLGIKDTEVRLSRTRYPRSAENSPTRTKSNKVFNQKSAGSSQKELFPQLKKSSAYYAEPFKNGPRKSRKDFLAAGSQTISTDDEFAFCPSTSSFSVSACAKVTNRDNKLPDLAKGKKKTFANSSVGDDEYDSLEAEEEEDYEPNGPAERTFKIIFLGDAGVGKSSFALRISQGVFIQHMSSTLGVDFLMRRMRVDGRNIDVQLWDTAGQERFRSITKPYFRKADGVMLLYDCTSELSFVHVRQWVEDVNVMASDKLPLMIIANKVDLRSVYSQLGTKCVSNLEGQKLARDCDTTFMEASAKDGRNVLPAIANLVRSMTNHRELQQSASTMKLHDMKKKDSGCCR